MKTRIGALGVLLGLFACAPALAAPVTVNLRVEGLKQTVYEGPITTDGHIIEQDRTGPHACNATNGGASTVPGPTLTSALDNGIAWNGTWSNSLQDFSIARIGVDGNNVAASRFWGYALNYKASQVGGCQQRVVNGDQVLFAFDFFNKKHLLKLTGPKTATSGRTFSVKVVDGQDGKAIAGAKLGKLKTNAKGIAKIVASGSGLLALKAERSDSVRSNELVVKVKPAPRHR